jgi:hypothetical protein
MPAAPGIRLSFSVNPRMRAGLQAALHLIRVECPAAPRPLASRGEPAGQGLRAPAGGLSRRALARGMIGPGPAVSTLLPAGTAGGPDPHKATARPAGAKEAALLHVAVLVAADHWRCAWNGALAAGASENEIADLLQTIAPVAGLGRVVCAASDVAIALGYDTAAALRTRMITDDSSADRVRLPAG